MGRLAHPAKYVVVAAQGFFGGHSLFSGLNYFFQWLPSPQVTHPLAGPFIDSMTAMGLFDVIKGVEALVGALLLLNILTPVALLMELPISISIFYTSVIVVHSERSLFTGTRELVLNLFLIAAYFGFYKGLLKLRPEMRPLWRWGAREPMTGSPGQG
ncbi:hypothetical protein [Hyphococcus luteus]|uniref:DoxX family protein n=1 Tax=Hyphococcus luteus TaxID=2058213 RepID=A0A2S7K543_9PROT|nr:hypothetical protein [Marinicaulis flavus]PQA87637.1 hypothetical protein CW354_11210 [Marinicaulis flavus]